MRASLSIIALFALAGCPNKLPPAADDTNNKEPGRICTTNEECASAYCIEFPTGRACAALCAGECSAGLVCKRAERRRPDAPSICVPAPAAGSLCAACSEDADCGDYGNLCITGASERFCGLDCSEGQPCPELYSCVSQTEGGQEISRQCVPNSSTCSCSAENAGMLRPCTKSNAAGSCAGEELCDADVGWLSCDAQTPVPELCDDQDNDCDDLVDEAPNGEPLSRFCGYGPEPRRAECLGEEVCDAGVWGGCSLFEPPSLETICDGLDDNCDGRVDEELLRSTEACGTCHTVCPPGPGYESSTVRTCSDSGSGYSCEEIKCRVPNFDVNGDDWDGCEVSDDYRLDGSSILLNSTWSNALPVGDGVSGCEDNKTDDDEHSCHRRLPSDHRLHVPTSPPEPNVDYYYFFAAASFWCTTETRACLWFPTLQSEDPELAIEVCASEPLVRRNEAPVFPSDLCGIVEPDSPLMMYYLGGTLNVYYYLRVKVLAGHFSGEYAVYAYDWSASDTEGAYHACLLGEPTDPCTYE